MELYHSANLKLSWFENSAIFLGEWKSCETADVFTEGITVYKEIFEKVIPEKIIWDETRLNYIIPPHLQQWVHEFLDKPAQDKGIDYKVAHIVSENILAGLSVVEMYTDEKVEFTPRFFGHKDSAVNWLTETNHEPPTAFEQAEWRIERFLKEGKARITIDLDLDHLPQYMVELTRLFKSGRFSLHHYARFKKLTVREKQTLKLILQGYANKQIADILRISSETVKTHRKNLLRKLECKNMAELMMYRVLY